MWCQRFTVLNPFSILYLVFSIIHVFFSHGEKLLTQQWGRGRVHVSNLYLYFKMGFVHWMNKLKKNQPLHDKCTFSNIFVPELHGTLLSDFLWYLTSGKNHSHCSMTPPIHFSKGYKLKFLLLKMTVYEECQSIWKGCAKKLLVLLAALTLNCRV